MKTLITVTLLALLTTTCYAQPYEPEHLWGRSGEEQDDYFGYTAAGIGDVNGDDCEDFIAYEREPNPRAIVFFGGNPPDTIPDLVFNNPYPYGYFGGVTENLGDVNGDGWDDFSIHGGYIIENMHRVFIYYGGDVLDTIPDVILSELTADDFFGPVIEGIGDVNGDGFADIAVQASNYDHVRGRVFVYLGGNPMDSIADWQQEGSAQHVSFGQSIAGKGDLNGDGYDDFAIYEWTGYPQNAGTTYYVYFGGIELDTVADLIIDGSEYYPEVDISNSSCIICNLNGDTFSELIIVGERSTNAIVFLGGNPMDTEIDLVLQGFDPDPNGWNMNVSAVGNINGDEYDDIIIGQYESDLWAGGRVLVYLGSPWMDGQPDMRWIGSLQPYWGCGISLADCGDINGDGVDDIMFGSYHMDFNSEGRLDIWKGDRTFMVSAPDQPPILNPQCLRLLPPYPNPFNRTVIIPFEILPGSVNDVSLKIYNVLGREVSDLTTDLLPQLQNTSRRRSEVTWSGKDNNGTDVGSGIYFVTIRSDLSHQVEKVVLLR